MSTDLAVQFDPYREWLHIQDPQRPLNPYQLLGLKSLEQDANRIRTAMTRQRALLEARQAEASPCWQKIHDELEDAISALLDRERRQLLDAKLKRQLNTQSRGATTTSLAHRPASVTCRKCGNSNSGQRHFCSGCGDSLFDDCPGCHTEVAADELFCGSCGANLLEMIRTQEESFEEQFTQARQLQRTYQFEAAIGVLRKIALIEDGRHAKHADKAQELIERFVEERAELEERAMRRFERAKEYLTRSSYEKAVEKLEGIPEALRQPDMKMLLAEAINKRNEVIKIGGEIRESIAENRKHDLLPKIARLLALKPDHTAAREMAEQLRDHIVANAKRQLIASQYEEARSSLEEIPEYVSNEDVKKLLDRASELAALELDLRLAPFVDNATVALAERLAKLSPRDEAAAQQAQEMRARRSAKPSQARFPYPNCGTPPQRTLLGLPLEWLAHLTRRDDARVEITATISSAPGRFFTAFGLALQAIDQAAVPINLLPSEKTGLLDRITFFRKSAPRAGWGLDLTPSGLKAIKLAPDLKDGRVRVEAAEFIEYSKPLTQAEDMERSDLMTEALRVFRQKHPFAKEVEKRERVVIALTGSRILGRFFDLPPVSSKKLIDLVTYEARHQIPVPLEELNWKHQVLKEAPGKQADEESRHVMVVAAKEFHVKERLTPFHNAEVPVDALTAEPLALHNAVAYEFAINADEPQQIAIFDLGSQHSNFVVSSPDALWFRTSGNGGDDFTDALVKQFQLTYGAAEKVKAEPHQARRFYELYEAWKPLCVQIGSEIERSLATYAKLHPQATIERLYLTGGTAATHGLMRYLIHGR